MSAVNDETPEIVDDMETWVKPVPEVDPLSREYFQAAYDGQLFIQRCPACRHSQHYPRMVCVRCATTPDWEAASGRGTVYSYTVIRQAGMPGFREEVPYVVALVDLEEGPRLMGNITGCNVDEVRIGDQLHAYFVRVAEGVGLVQWRLKETTR